MTQIFIVLDYLFAPLPASSRKLQSSPIPPPKVYLEEKFGWPIQAFFWLEWGFSTVAGDKTRR